MASESAGAGLLGQLNTLFRFGVVGDLSDGQLLQRFLTGRDGADQVAFTALVERHGAPCARKEAPSASGTMVAGRIVVGHHPTRSHSSNATR